MRNGYIEEGLGRSPYGERGLKFFAPSCQVFLFCRSPYGERGLKLYPQLQ